MSANHTPTPDFKLANDYAKVCAARDEFADGRDRALALCLALTAERDALVAALREALEHFDYCARAYGTNPAGTRDRMVAALALVQS